MSSRLNPTAVKLAQLNELVIEAGQSSRMVSLVTLPL